jgi:hypothetical protein
MAMPGAATVSERWPEGFGVMRGCEPVAMTRGGGGGWGAPGTRACVALGSFGGEGFGFKESSFATFRKSPG